MINIVVSYFGKLKVNIFKRLILYYILPDEKLLYEGQLKLSEIAILTTTKLRQIDGKSCVDLGNDVICVSSDLYTIPLYQINLLHCIIIIINSRGT